MAHSNGSAKDQPFPALLGFACLALSSLPAHAAEPSSLRPPTLPTAPLAPSTLSLSPSAGVNLAPIPFSQTAPSLSSPPTAPRPIKSGTTAPAARNKPSSELAPIDDSLLKALPDFKDIELAPTLVPDAEIRFSETNATAQARRELQARIRFRELKHVALRDPELALLDKQVRSATTDRHLRSALASYNERLYSLIRKLDPSLTPLIEERKAASLKGTGIQSGN
jgi:hypothetical protein